MRYFVGIDQGGTKCDVIIADENGRIIDRYTDIGYSKMLVDEKTESNEAFFGKCIKQQIDYLKILLEKHGIESNEIYALVSSGSCAEISDVATLYKQKLHDSFPTENIFVCNDMISAWRAGTNTYPGGVIGMGTGTGIVFFKEKDKPVFLTPKITKQANKMLGFRAFFHACYSGVQVLEPTLLSDYVCEFAKTASISEAFEKTNNCLGINALHYQYFVPYIYEAYLKNDIVSQTFIREVALDISNCIRSAIAETDLNDTPFTLVLNGGAFKGNGYIMADLIKSNLADLTDITVIQAEYEPIYGALMLAYEKFGESMPQISNAAEYDLFRKLS